MIFCPSHVNTDNKKPPRREVLISLLLVKVANNEVDDGVCQSTNHETNDTVKNGVFSLFNLTSVARRGHVKDTTNYDDDHSNDTEGTDNRVQDAGELAVCGSWINGFFSAVNWVDFDG